MTTPNPGVRCPDPKCDAKLAEALDGRLAIVCRKCGELKVIVRLSPATVPLEGRLSGSGGTRQGSAAE